MMFDRERWLYDPLHLAREELLQALDLDPDDPRSIGELVLGPDGSPDPPAEPVEMVVIDGVRYRPENAPGESA